MRKVTLTALAALFMLSFLTAQSNDANEAYIKAMTANSPEQRFQLLKEFVTKFGGQASQYENFAYANLCLLPVKGRTDKETIDYGEKALSLGGLDDLSKYKVLITVSSIYVKLGQNLDKAKNYALQSIQIAQANKGKESELATSAQWNQFIGAGYFVQGQAQEKAKDLKTAVDSYIASYNILKNKEIVSSLVRVAKILYESKLYADAEKALKVASPVLGDSGSLVLYAMTLHRLDRKDEALKYYKQAYAKQKSGELAYNIGLILASKAKTAPGLADEAIQYLLEASFLSQSNSKKALEVAEGLYFNKDPKYNESIRVLADKSKKMEELTATFNKKFGEKEEEDLSEAEKKEMASLLKEIEAEKQAVEKLQADQEMILASFNKLIEQIKAKLGVK